MVCESDYAVNNLSEYSLTSFDDTDLDPDFVSPSCVTSSDESLFKKRIKRRNSKRRRNRSNLNKRELNLSSVEENQDLLFAEGINKVSSKVLTFTQKLPIWFKKYGNQTEIDSSNVDYFIISNQKNEDRIADSVCSSIDDCTVKDKSDTSGYLSFSSTDEASVYGTVMASEHGRRDSESDRSITDDIRSNCSKVSRNRSDGGNGSSGIDNDFSSLMADVDENSLIDDDTTTDRSEVFDCQESDLDFNVIKQIHDLYYSLSLKTIEKLKKLDIDVHWQVPKAHSHHDSFTVYSHHKLNFELERDGSRLKEGLFTSEEDEIIFNNWNRFKMTYGFNNPSLFLIGFLPKSVISNVQKKKFVLFLGYGLDNRSLRSIYERFDEMFGSEIFNTHGRFSCREEQVVAEMNEVSSAVFNKSYNKLKILQSILMRKRVALSRKANTHRKGKLELTKRIRWSKEKLNKLVRLIIKESKTENFELVEKQFKAKQWNKIARKLRCNSGTQLEMFWRYRLSVQLTCKHPIFRNSLRSELIQWFHNCLHQFNDWNDVDWSDIAREFNVSSCFLYRKFRKMAVTYVPMEKLQNVKDTVEHLHDNFLPILESGKLKDYCLKRLKYTKGSGLIEMD